MATMHKKSWECADTFFGQLSTVTDSGDLQLQNGEFYISSRIRLHEQAPGPCAFKAPMMVRKEGCGDDVWPWEWEGMAAFNTLVIMCSGKDSATSSISETDIRTKKEFRNANVCARACVPMTMNNSATRHGREFGTAVA